MSDPGTTTLRLSPNWKPAGSGEVVLYAQACHAGSWPQRVTIQGPGLPKNGVTETSDPQTQFGTQFLNKQVILDYTEQYQNYLYTVKIEFNPGGGWQPAAIAAGVNNRPIGKKNDDDEIAVLGIVLSNDSGGDNDWNDAVVTLTMFDQSAD